MNLPPVPDLASLTNEQLLAWASLIRAEVLEEAIKACDDVDEPPWFGYECPNTFQDGQRQCMAAIRALKG